MSYSAGTNEFLVENITIGQAKNRTEYASLILRRGSSMYEAKLWGWAPDMGKDVAVGKIIRIDYVEETYQGRPQLNIKAFAKGTLPLEEFLQKSRFSIDAMLGTIMNYRWEEPFGKIIAEVFKTNDMERKFREYPAALKVHGSWVGGLLEHTWSMWTMAMDIVKHYQKYAPISLDKVLFGVVMHDLGKVLEYERKGSAYIKSTSGVLMGHIASGILFVDRAITKVCPELDSKEREEILHLISSHHGKTEWGSPVPPATLEALIIHQLDMLDSHFVHALGMIEAGPSPENVELTQHSRYHGTQYLMQELENGEEDTSRPDGSPGGSGGKSNEDTPW